MTDSVLTASNSAIGRVGRKIKKDQANPRDWDVLREFRDFRAASLLDTFPHVVEALEGLTAQATCRIKRVRSIVRKLRRESTMDLVRMDDLVGLRVLVETRDVQADAINMLDEHLSISRVRDYVKAPRSDGYRAVHLIGKQMTFSEDGKPRQYPFEIQVRTCLQNLWANTSEAFGEQVKEGGGPEHIRSYLTKLSGRIEQTESTEADSGPCPPLQTRGNLYLTTLLYDRRNGQITAFDQYGADVSRALKGFSYLEEKYLNDAAREVVLLGFAANPEVLISVALEELAVSHVRYYATGTFPTLPSYLVEDLPRPRS